MNGHDFLSVCNLRNDDADCHSDISSVADAGNVETYEIMELCFHYVESRNDEGLYTLSFEVSEDVPLGAAYVRLSNVCYLGKGDKSVMLGLPSLYPTLTPRRCRIF